MQTVAKTSVVGNPPAKPDSGKPPGLASAPVPDTLAALRADSATGLTHAEVDIRRKEHGCNEVAEKKGHPALMFLGKFWGLSAWMLELIMVLSAVLGNYSDLAVVSGLLVVNAVVSFVQEHRAAGVVAILRRRLQVSARVLRDASWQVIPARELVPGDIVRVRPGDIILWATMPSKAVVAAVIAEVLAGTVLTRVGLPKLFPLPWPQTLAVFAYAMVACLVVNDAVKVAMIRWRVPNTMARKPVDLTPQIAKRAYELYEQRGRQQGRAVQDWGQAEREIRDHGA